MRRIPWLIVVGLSSAGLVCSAGVASGQGCFESLELVCPEATRGDTAEVSVLITTCQGAVQAFGFEVVFDSDQLLFVGAGLAGTAVESWEAAGAEVVDGSTSRVRVGGFDPVGVGVVEGFPLITLRFFVLSSLPFDAAVVFDRATLVDDVTGFMLFDCAVPAPVEETTWGAVKAVFE